MKLDAGQVVLLPFPYTNLKSGKKRPALVLTGADFHDNSSDLVLAYMTSQRQSSDWGIGITNADLASGQLVKDSWIRVDRLATIEQRLVQRVVGQLKPTTLAKVRRLVVELLG